VICQTIVISIIINLFILAKINNCLQERTTLNYICSPTLIQRLQPTLSLILLPLSGYLCLSHRRPPLFFCLSSKKVSKSLNLRQIQPLVIERPSSKFPCFRVTYRPLVLQMAGSNCVENGTDYGSGSMDVEFCEVFTCVGVWSREEKCESPVYERAVVGMTQFSKSCETW